MHKGFRAAAQSLAFAAVFAMAASLAGCASAPRYTRGSSPKRPAPSRPATSPGARGGGVVGTASYYGPGFDGKKTASGERFDQHALTAAHRALPFGTRVRVTNLANGKDVTVRINDRGPFKKHRLIDLSLGAAREIGMTGAGTARVRLEVVE